MKELKMNKKQVKKYKECERLKKVQFEGFSVVLNNDFKISFRVLNQFTLHYEHRHCIDFR